MCCLKGRRKKRRKQKKHRHRHESSASSRESGSDSEIEEMKRHKKEKERVEESIGKEGEETARDTKVGTSRETNESLSTDKTTAAQ